MKKKKDQWEEEAKNHFVAELKAQGRGESIVVDSDVVVDAQTNRNFDYQVKCGDDFIALEIFRLVESQQEIVRSKSWSTIADSIAAELRRKGIKGYTIQTPNAFNVSRRKIPEFVSKISSAGLDADWRTTPLSRPRVYRTAIPSMVVTVPATASRRCRPAVDLRPTLRGESVSYQQLTNVMRLFFELLE